MCRDIFTVLSNLFINFSSDPTTIFRGNTLVSKMMDEAMRLIGLQYLHKTLRPTIELVFLEKKSCEIDPTRVKDVNQVEANLNNLKSYVQRIFEAITNSAVHCPALMCQIFHNLKECAMKCFPENREVRYSVISGFIFLRFFAPAILGPRLFDLTTQQIVSSPVYFEIFRATFHSVLGCTDQSDPDIDIKDDSISGQLGQLQVDAAGL